MKTFLRLFFFVLASVSHADPVFRSDVHIGQNWGTVRVSRNLKLQVNGPIINTYRYRVATVTNWTSIASRQPMVPWNVLVLRNQQNVPGGFNQSMSGHLMTIPSKAYLLEFDFNNNDISDGSVPVYAPQCEMTLYYPGGTGSYFDFTAPDVVVTLNTGGEPTVSVHDPMPVLGDSDGDGIADEYDPDDDNDGIPDEIDMFPNDPAENNDNDGDGIGDVGDEDDDNDGKPDGNDPFPKNPGEDTDEDGDGWGSNTDPDDNDPSKPGGDGGGAGDGSEDGTGPPSPGGGGGGDRTGDDPRLNETSEGFSPTPEQNDGGKGQQLADKANNAGGKMGSKLFGFLPAQASPIPMATVMPINIQLSNGIGINESIRLDSAPFPQLRVVFLVCFTALCGVAFLKKVTI